MAVYLRPLSSSLTTFVNSQILFRPNNEVALILFGSAATDNAVNKEMQKRRKMGQYLHISQLKGLHAPDRSYLDAIEKLKAEQGKPDYVDAMTVAIDCIKRRLAKAEDPSRYLKRILIFSDFSRKVRDHEEARECGDVLLSRQCVPDRIFRRRWRIP